ncbi:hypothetical protein GCM10010136_19160 [Limoniibacter endophyticus]|uniref:Uncharacterized protein n=1 Tax=Limoniibacter endophyticus TaxID=1565040 RepID=A0A8J3DMU3_9HYPH|nr:hypothetical protein GCM10010136_19160 [Limoniibacter endophyticus]
MIHLDGDEPKQRIARGLNVDREKRFQVAPGDEETGAHDFCSIARADPQEAGWRKRKPHKRTNQQRRQKC